MLFNSLTIQFFGILIITAILGLIIGSFLNVVIYRYPMILKKQWRNDCLHYLKLPAENSEQKFNLSLPHSHCRQCKIPLQYWHNIPLLSYLLLHGRCKNCKTKISVVYPLIEGITAVTFIFILLKFGIHWPTLALLIFASGLIILTAIDIQEQLLPDTLTLSLLWLGLLCNAFNLLTTPYSAILGAIAGYLSLWSVNYLFRCLRKKDGMGYGDFKMLAMLGAWLGADKILFLILISTGLALFYSLLLLAFKKLSRNQPFAFGPFLAAAGWVILMCPTQFIF